MKNILLVSSLLFVSILNAQENSVITASKSNGYGLHYNLPLTEIKVTVKCKKTVATEGVYSKYAERYMGTPATISEGYTKWEIVDAKLQSYSVPDLSNRYLSIFAKGYPTSFYIDKVGVLRAINVSPSDTLPLTLVSPFTIEKKATALPPDYAAYSEEVLVSGTTAKMAEIASKQLYRIRESRFDLLTGNSEQFPTDGEAFRLLTQGLDTQEALLTSLFMGRIEENEEIFTFTFLPENDIEEVLFRFSNQLGVLPVNDLAGLPFYISVKILERGSIPHPILPESGKKSKKEEEEGINYRVPGKAAIALSFKGKELTKEHFVIAQFGELYALPNSLFCDKKMPYKALFNSQTGQLKSLELIDLKK